MNKQELWKAMHEPLPKYGVQIQFENDWLWVHDSGLNGIARDDIHPCLFDTIEQAEEHADIWRQPGHEDKVKVLKYDPVHEDT